MAVNSTFDIEIRYTGDSRFQGAFQAAADRWEQIITADLPDVSSSNFGFVDDLLIDASVVFIDGNGGILASAGPDWVRSASFLPFHGIMQFDSADVEVMFNSGILTAVILHEMGHVLGIGTLWDEGPFTLIDPNTHRYFGANALAEYRSLTGNPSATFIPIEDNGGPGTVNGHWDEETFNAEIMTGFVESAGTSMPISRMTIASLADLGYSVNLSAADGYSLPGGPPPPPPPPANDTKVGTASADTLHGLGGNDTLSGLGGNDLLYGDDDNDVLDGGADNDQLDGGAGNDRLIGGAGSDQLIGGSGVDTADYSSSIGGTGVVVDLRNGTATGGAGADTLNGIENVWGSNFNDTLYSNGQANALDGRGGTDTLSYAGASQSVIIDMYASVAVSGGVTDALLNIENAIGTGLNDTIAGNAGANVLDGQGGTDRVSYYLATQGVTINLAAGTGVSGGVTDTLLNFENANGSGYNDTIIGNSSANVLTGSAGNDIFVFVAGSANGDTVADFASGDQLRFEGYGTAAQGATLTRVDTTHWSINSANGLIHDVITFSNGVTIPTSAFLFVGSSSSLPATDDTKIGTGSADTLNGFGGNDTLSGLAGNDFLYGDEGNDRLDGGADNDQLDGGTGIDTADYSASIGGTGVVVDLRNGTATGGAGADTLVGIENVWGSDFNDTLYSNGQVNALDGRGGIDTVSYAGASQSVIIDMYAGVAVSAGVTDTLLNLENATGTGLNDVIAGNVGANVLDGQGGTDKVSYYLATQGVTVDLAAGTGVSGGVTDTLLNFESADGSNYNDVISGNAAANVLDGRGGTDTVSYAPSAQAVIVDMYAGVAVSAGVTDTLRNFENATGSAFNDTIAGNNGANVLDGGGGIDRVSYYLATQGVTINLAAGTAVSAGVTDLLWNFENANGSGYNDTIIGNSSVNVLTGAAGNDIFVFVASAANGDSIIDFNGGGAAAGDQLRFEGYGTAAQGARLTQVDATHWSINSANGLIHDVITVSNGAAIHTSDYLFV